jgi:murein DD-endopeptidase MepM/ murein hydrolase activator NlpD
MTIYGHLSKTIVAKGQIVKAGQLLGYTGNTGFSSAPHLHWEMRPLPLKSNNGYAGAADQFKI